MFEAFTGRFSGESMRYLTGGLDAAGAALLWRRYVGVDGSARAGLAMRLPKDDRAASAGQGVR
jgi:hypothetical protein